MSVTVEERIQETTVEDRLEEKTRVDHIKINPMTYCELL
jgi:hypothetical protein